MERLEAERQAHKTTAERCEAKARAALSSGNREAWEHWSHEADLAWQCNAYVVGLIDANG